MYTLCIMSDTPRTRTNSYGGGNDTPMSTVQDIAKAICQLSPEDLVALRTWFTAFDAERWDQQFAEDVAAGRLDCLAEGEEGRPEKRLKSEERRA